MKKKALIVFVVAGMILTLLETVELSNRIEKDENYIDAELGKRDRIGKRNLVGRKLVIGLDYEKKITKEVVAAEEFKTLLADRDSLVVVLEEQNVKILADILHIADNGDGYQVQLAIFDTQKKAVLNYQKTIAKAITGGLIVIDLRLYKYAETEAALAGVLAHEVAHILLRHSSRFEDYFNDLHPPFCWPAMIYYFGTSGTFGMPMIEGARRAREQEEADILAVQYCWMLGYEPEEYLKASKKFGSDPGRISAIEREIGLLKQFYPKQKLVKYKFTTEKEFQLYRTLLIK